MYTRDFGILLLSVCALFLSLQNEGPFDFKKAWYHHFDEVGELIKPPERLPAPVVVDLNGDGKPEIVTAAPNGALLLLAPRKPGNGFERAMEIAQIDISSLVSDNTKDPGSIHAAAFQVGYTAKLPKEVVWAPRKQSLVVVTTDLQVLRLDHNLKLIWKQDLKEHFPADGVLREVAIHISDSVIDVGDEGIIVVGASVTPPTLAEAEENEDVLEEELDIEGIEEHHARGRAKGGAIDELKLKGSGKTGRHFSYFAFEGGKGLLRWKHEAQDFHKDLSSLQEELRAQHAFHGAAQQEIGLHYGEASCRDFRESILAALPHSWHSNYDTAIKLAHFEKHKAHKGAQKARLSTIATKKDHGAAAGGGTKVQNAIGSVVKSTVQSGTERRHHANSTAPNVLIAHVEEGIEAIHLYSGRTVCRLFLSSPGLHVDLNGDGIPDHVLAVGGDPTSIDIEAAREDADRAHAHTHHNFCHATVTSGIPPQQPLFNGTVCRNYKRMIMRRRGANRMLYMAPPIMLPLPGKHGRYAGSDLRRQGLAVFLNSVGEVMAYHPSGTLRWHASTPCSWSTTRVSSEEEDEESSKYVSPMPTLVAMPLRTHAIPTVILIAGDTDATIASEHGREITTFDLPEFPLQPLKVVDFNFDGYNDIILVGERGVYGWAQVRKPGALPFSALIGGLIVIMLAVFVTQQGFMQSGSKVKGRSTDRID